MDVRNADTRAAWRQPPEGRATESDDPGRRTGEVPAPAVGGDVGRGELSSRRAAPPLVDPGAGRRLDLHGGHEVRDVVLHGLTGDAARRAEFKPVTPNRERAEARNVHNSS